MSIPSNLSAARLLFRLIGRLEQELDLTAVPLIWEHEPNAPDWFLEHQAFAVLLYPVSLGHSTIRIHLYGYVNDGGSVAMQEGLSVFFPIDRFAYTRWWDVDEEEEVIRIDDVIQAIVHGSQFRLQRWNLGFPWAEGFSP